jgi:hypothetical protein
MALIVASPLVTSAQTTSNEPPVGRIAVSQQGIVSFDGVVVTNLTLKDKPPT